MNYYKLVKTEVLDIVSVNRYSYLMLICYEFPTLNNF